ncbi:uncharacterized protein LOC118193137 isoform X2 [Stegodyphus dumicola]|nr:uncharacterized protein LOC118193137 isoform X2 [Stegodyphus dumicola]
MMSCELCLRNSHHCQSFSHCPSCDARHYSDVPPVPQNLEEEPVAPTLSLGNRILWLTETRAASGIVRWIGRIPSVSSGWSAGIEFDNVFPDGGNGDFRGRLYFTSRPGHALFLPVSQLIKVDDSSSSASAVDRTSFFGRLQDSCSNFAHRRRRDSTFGYFKQDLCSNCAQNEGLHNGHSYVHGPVYDRITTRQSMCYEDRPYEAYNACNIRNPIQNSTNQALENYHNRRLYNDHIQTSTKDCSKFSSLRPSGRFNGMEYPEDDFCASNFNRKHSLSNPRSSLRLISDFKDWVSCLVLGTNRHKQKNKIVLKDRKSLTSIFLSHNSQSLTGQRLSSFSEYASINVCKVPKPELKPKSVKDLGNSSESSLQSRQQKCRSRKKRPAPLPPIQHSDSSTCDHSQNSHVVTGKSRNDTVVKAGIPKEKENRNQIGFKIVRNNSIRSHGTLRRRRKKRRAPLPPPLSNVTNLNIASAARSESEKEHKNLNYLDMVPDSNSNDKLRLKRSEKLRHAKQILKELEDEEFCLSNPRLKKAKRKVLSRQELKNLSSTSIDIESKGNSETDDAQISTSRSISFSEEGSEEEKYGLVKYGMMKHLNSSEKGSSLSNSSNFLQYSNDNSDICLKISIQKTETNVVTVEEVSAPRTVTYTIEEDSSSSELSEEPVVLDIGKKLIKDNQESKHNLTDSSSVSTEEASDKSKTIFEELQIKPPVKGTVKDFVQAFNMLATKSAGEVGDRRLPGQSANGKSQNNSLETNRTKTDIKAIQSFPTNWEYQTDKAAGQGYTSSQFLLPIAEESHNEASEHDGSISVDDSNALNSDCTMKMKSAKDMMKTTGSVVASSSTVNENTSKKCSHCSERHSLLPDSELKENDTKKFYKKKVAPKHMKAGHVDTSSSMKRSPSSKASLAALSSLLQENNLPGSKGGKNPVSCNSGNHSLKLNQPIMVGLYIEDKSSHRGPIPLLITPSMSLKKLKKQIEKEYKFPRHQQCWILGEAFAINEDASLASYGVTEPGSPILLYVMAKDSKSHSLPSRPSSRLRCHQKANTSDSSEEEVNTPRRRRKSKTKMPSYGNLNDKHKQVSGDISKRADVPAQNKTYAKVNQLRKNDVTKKKPKSEFHKAWEAEYEKKTDYRTLLALDDVDLVANVEPFECPICFLDIGCEEGAVLQECLHSFCRECLASAIQYSETAVIKCPFRNDEYSCESHLQEREIKSLVSPQVYEKHLQRSMALAESQALDSFHCKTPDCPGWCLFEDNVNTFLCPVCKHTNCLTCAAIHEGKNCRQFQDDVAFRCDSSEEAKKTKEYLQNMVQNGEAMECPQCQVILMKKWGCDWLKCSMCHTEVCWVTKGPRWGPGGRGDTSGGCKCMVDGSRCHPKCSYCH